MGAVHYKKILTAELIGLKSERIRNKLNTRL